MIISLAFTEQADARVLNEVETLEIELPVSCEYCGFKNLKMYGTRTKGIARVEVRCVRCGKILVLIDEDG